MNKVILSFLLVFINSLLIAQAPLGLNYQAIYRDGQGIPLSNKNINIKFSILNGSMTGPVVYSETHSNVTTNQFGLFTRTIGQGFASIGTFSTINWGQASKFLKVEVNNNLIGTTQLLSVPYSFYSDKSNIASLADIADKVNRFLTYNTLQINSLSNQVAGSVVYNSDDKNIWFFDGSSWNILLSSKVPNTSGIVVKNGLIAYYNFDDQKATDIIGGHNGDIFGSTISSDILLGTKGSSMLFNQQKFDKIIVPSNPLSGNSIGSINVWIKSSSCSGTLLEVGNQGVNSPYGISFSSNNCKLYYRYGNTFSYSLTNLLDNQWHMLTITYSISSIKLYIDASLKETVSTTNGMGNTNGNGSGLVIGNHGVGTNVESSGFNGKIDNLRIYGSTLSLSEVQEIFNAKQ